MKDSTIKEPQRAGRPKNPEKAKALLVYPTPEERAAFESYATSHRRPLGNAIIFLALESLRTTANGNGGGV